MVLRSRHVTRDVERETDEAGRGRERGGKTATEDGVRNIGTFWYQKTRYLESRLQGGRYRERQAIEPLKEVEKGAKRARNAKRK